MNVAGVDVAEVLVDDALGELVVDVVVDGIGVVARFDDEYFYGRVSHSLAAHDHNSVLFYLYRCDVRFLHHQHQHSTII